MTHTTTPLHLTVLVALALSACTTGAPSSQDDGHADGDERQAVDTTSDDAGVGLGGPGLGPDDDEPLTEPEVSGPSTVEAEHLDGRVLEIRASDQRFQFMPSIVALAALGDAASDGLEEIDYAENAEVWADHVQRELLTVKDANDVATSVAAMGILQTNTGGAFLTAAQEEEVRAYLSWAASEPGYAENHVVASALAVASRHFAHEQERLTGRDLDIFLPTDRLCSPSTWTSKTWEVAAQLLTNGLDACTPEQLSSNWATLAAHVAEFDESPPRTDTLEGMGLLHLVHDADHADVNTDPDRFAQLRTDYLGSLSGTDPWEWLWGHYKFELGISADTAPLERSAAARTVLTFFAARGTPEIREVQ